MVKRKHFRKCVKHEVSGVTEETWYINGTSVCPLNKIPIALTPSWFKSTKRFWFTDVFFLYLILNPNSRTRSC